MQGSLMLDLQGTWLSAHERAVLRQPQVCGVILFARNVEHPQQLAQLCRSIKAVRSDLLIAVDQEGGRVRRLRRGFTPIPSMRAIAHSAAAQKTAELCGWLMAAEVLAVGIDFSFAPVLDLDYGHNTVIGTRSFGADVERVTCLAQAFMQGMNKAGMANVGKHFPGHGWVEADSHFAVPVDRRTMQSIEQSDLQVFARLAQEMTAVMPAHVIYSDIDPLPAGFSKYWLQQVLRQQLGFTGLIFSDDLCMAGAHVVGDIAARTLAAISAGCDIALVCNDPAAAEQALITLQKEKVSACPGTSVMLGKHSFQQDYQHQPEFQLARRAISSLTEQ